MQEASGTVQRKCRDLIHILKRDHCGLFIETRTPGAGQQAPMGVWRCRWLGWRRWQWTRCGRDELLASIQILKLKLTELVDGLNTECEAKRRR